jgi:hypothetical protein
MCKFQVVAKGIELEWQYHSSICMVKADVVEGDNGALHPEITSILRGKPSEKEIDPEDLTMKELEELTVKVLDRYYTDVLDIESEKENI